MAVGYPEAGNIDRQTRESVGLTEFETGFSASLEAVFAVMARLGV